MELIFDEVFGEINIGLFYKNILKIEFGRFVKEVIRSALKQHFQFYE